MSGTTPHGDERSQISSRLEEMAVSAEALAGSTDLNETLRRLATRAKELSQADYAAIGIFGANGELDRFIYVGIDEATARRLGDPPNGKGLLGTLARRTRPLRLTDLTAHPESSGWPEGHPRMRAFLGVPIRTAGRTIGSLYMTRDVDSEPFSESDELAGALLALQVAGTVSAAIAQDRNARSVLLEERVRIAQDLHDGTIQSLYAVGLQLSAASVTALSDEVRGAIDDSIEQINRVIAEMREYISMLEATLPVAEPDLSRDLTAAVRQIVPEGVETRINITAGALQEVRAREAEDLLYIAREALSNAVRHGRASRIGVDLRQSAEATALTIQDNGLGFDADTVRRGLGSVTMRTRAERIAGTLTVIGIPGMGTTVRITLPRRFDIE
jgi:signal transduction histidine kinase